MTNTLAERDKKKLLHDLKGISGRGGFGGEVCASASLEIIELDLQIQARDKAISELQARLEGQTALAADGYHGKASTV